MTPDYRAVAGLDTLEVQRVPTRPTNRMSLDEGTVAGLDKLDQPLVR